MNARTLPASQATAVTLRRLQRGDGARLHDLVAACPPLDLNSRYAYLLLGEHYGSTSAIAESGGEIVGAVTGYVPPTQPDTLFVWQVAVSAQCRGQRLGSQMLEYLLDQCMVPRQLRWMETTISPSNQASHALFTGFAARHGVGCSTTTLFGASDFGASGHEEERLYKIGPWDRAA